jgi:hypothetical protein
MVFALGWMERGDEIVTDGDHAEVGFRHTVKLVRSKYMKSTLPLEG